MDDEDKPVPRNPRGQGSFMPGTIMREANHPGFSLRTIGRYMLITWLLRESERLQMTGVTLKGLQVSVLFSDCCALVVLEFV